MTQVFAVHARTGTHLMVTRAVAALPGSELVGRTFSAVVAARVVGTLSPDVVTVDARLPDGDGLQLAARLRAGRPDLGVVLVGPAANRRLMLGAVAAGVSTFLPEGSGVEQAAAAIQRSMTGLASYSAELLAGALRREWATTLSRREHEVLHLVREGLPAAQIAARLRVSESTVRTHLSRVRMKLAMAGRAFDTGLPVTDRRTRP